MELYDKQLAAIELDEHVRPSNSRLVSLRDHDAQALAKTGKKQVLKRRFGMLSMCGLALTSTLSWEAIILTLSVGLANGGPAGLIWGCLLTWAGTGSVFICMGELVSMYPTSGGQFYFAYALAPPRWKTLLSYVTGWVTVLTWIAAPTLLSYLASSTLIDLIAFLQPSYSPQPWHGLLISWAVLVMGVTCNTLLGALMPLIELSFLILHIIGFFAFLITLANLGPPGDARQVFTQFNNEGGWPNVGLAFLVGLQGAAGSFTGGDSSIHLAEEVYHSNVAVARAINLAIAINGALSFVILSVILYVAGPLDQLVGVESPFQIIIFNVTKSNTAVGALVGFLVLMSAAACCSAIATGSRMMWSFARDRGLPLWTQLRKVDKRLALPMTSIAMVTLCSALLLLIQLGSGVVLNIVLSLLVVGYFISYLCAIAPLLYQRVLGNINNPDQDDRPEATYTWGPWRLSGWFGTLNNTFAVAYLVLVGFFNFWPPTATVDAESMNWSCLILGSVAMFSAIYYLVWARKTFTGPIVEIARA